MGQCEDKKFMHKRNRRKVRSYYNRKRKKSYGREREKEKTWKWRISRII